MKNKQYPQSRYFTVLRSALKYHTSVASGSGSRAKSVLSASNTDSLTAEIACFKNGQSLGTNSVRFPASCIGTSPVIFLAMSDDNKDMTLFVDESRSSKSRRISHNMLTMMGT